MGLANYKQLFRQDYPCLSEKQYPLCSDLHYRTGWFWTGIGGCLEDTVFPKAAPFFRSVYFIPTVVSVTVVCLLFKFVYNPADGPVEQLLQAVEIRQP